MQGASKGKEPMQPPHKQPVQANTTGKTTQQLPPEQSVQSRNKGKQPEQSRPHQSTQADPKGRQVERRAQASLESEQLPQASREQSENATVKGKQPEVKSTQEPPGSKAILAGARMYCGFPKVYITRIPGNKNGKPRAMRRVEVYVIPDTAYRHPQTFFFKNIPNVEYYWGLLNDAATTAQRIIRMEYEGKPTPYFLHVCRGEYPKVKSTRNDNAVFADMDVPVFGDAFVFKLADPEITEDGYARYAHIEKDLGSIDWIPEAIRDAASKVDNAMAPSANPGFPDIENYADPETMAKDAQRMFTYMKAIRKAATKNRAALPIHAKPEKPETPNDDMKKRLIEQMTILLVDWENDISSSVEGGPEQTSDQNLGQGFEQKAVAAFRPIEGSADAGLTLDGALSTSPIACSVSFDIKTTETVEGVHDTFRAMMVAFNGFYGEMQVAREAVEGASNKSEIDDAINKVYVAFRAMLAEIDKAEVNMQDFYELKVKVAKKSDAASKVDAAGTSEANPEMADLPGHPGTSRYRVERFD